MKKLIATLFALLIITPTVNAREATEWDGLAVQLERLVLDATNKFSKNPHISGRVVVMTDKEALKLCSDLKSKESNLDVAIAQNPFSLYAYIINMKVGHWCRKTKMHRKGFAEVFLRTMPTAILMSAKYAAVLDRTGAK